LTLGLSLGCSAAQAMHPADVASAASDSDTNPTDGAATHIARDDRGPVLPWLSPSHVAAAVRVQEAAFGACQELDSSPPQGRDDAVTVGWLVGANGTVTDVTLGQSTFTSALVNDCVLSVARQVTFPASASSAQVVWTVRLRAAEGGPFAEAGRYRNRR